MKSSLTVSVLLAVILSPLLASAAPAVAATAGDVTPLLIGATVPEVPVRDIGGKTWDLKTFVEGEPTVLIFYRGGWCPFCNTHLAEIGEMAPKIREAGVRIVGISPDRPEKLAETAGKDEVDFVLLSDSKMDAARAFGIAFQVDDATVTLYKEQYKIDLEGDSGETHHQLPVPAAFVVNGEGTIVFSYVNPDYKTRANPDVLLAAIRTSLR